MLHHSHFDCGYTHSQPIMWELQREYIDQAIDWLEETADRPDGVLPKWTCEALEPVRRWVAKAPRSQRERFQKLVVGGRIGLAALRWNTSAAVDRPALQRLLDGKDELEQLTGVPIKVACQHDVNGVPWSTADVLLDAGVDLLVTGTNLGLGRPVRPRPGMFLWEAPSGRSIRVFNGHHYTMFDQLMLAWHDSVDRMAEGWAGLAQRLDEIEYPLDFVYLTSTCSPVMWDNAPPNPFMPDLIRRWNEADHGPPVRYATFDDLRERALAVPEAELLSMRGDWTDFWSFGYGSTPVATALNQQAKPLIAAAELLTAGAEHPTLQSARDKVDLFDEHTWGYFDTRPEHPQAQTGELLKQALAHEGHELAAFAVMDGLERLAANPLDDKGIKGVLLFNPSPHPVTVHPELPASWFAARTAENERTIRGSRMFYGLRSWGQEFPGADPVRFGAVELGPRSWRSIPLADLPEPAAPRVVHIVESDHIERRELNFAAQSNHVRRVGRIESPFHVLRYNMATGRVLSLVDRAQNRELLAIDSELDFFSFVRERPDALVDGSRYAFYESDLDKEKYDIPCWKDWTKVHERATRVLSTVVRESAGRVTLERTLVAPGMRHLVQRISLLEDDPVIHLEAELELEHHPDPQAVYLAFPLAMDAGWQAAFDTAGDTVRLDVEQLPGSCRNWVTAESMATMWDEQGAISLLLPDAPLAQFGDFHFGPPLDSVPRPADPLLLAWPVNNYWFTNYPRVQLGRIHLRYGFLSLPADERDDVRRHASAMRQVPLMWPITSGGRGADSGTLPSGGHR
jgi:alpha-mannosidase